MRQSSGALDPTCMHRQQKRQRAGALQDAAAPSTEPLKCIAYIDGFNKRFTADFAFLLSADETAEVVTNCDHLRLVKFSPVMPHALPEKSRLWPRLRSQSVTLKRGQHRKYLSKAPKAFFGVSTKVLNQAVIRNRQRFPEDFLFQLTAQENQSQIVTGSQQYHDKITGWTWRHQPNSFAGIMGRFPGLPGDSFPLTPPSPSGRGSLVHRSLFHPDTWNWRGWPCEPPLPLGEGGVRGKIVPERASESVLFAGIRWASVGARQTSIMSKTLRSSKENQPMAEGQPRSPDLHFQVRMREDWRTPRRCRAIDRAIGIFGLRLPPRSPRPMKSIVYIDGFNKRFPANFAFLPSAEEKATVVANCDHLRRLKFSPVIPHDLQEEARMWHRLRSQSVTLNRGQHLKYLPKAFTEHGALMAANVLNSPRAAEMSVYVIRAFVKIRAELAKHHDLALRLAEIEKTLLGHDGALRDLYQKIRPLLLPPPDPKRREIGFHTVKK